MLIARPTPKPAQIGLSPLIDVVFLLLIFFVVTTSFRSPELPIELPEATGEPSAASDALSVSVSADGGVSIEGERIGTGELPERIAAADPDTVVVRADGAASHRSVVTVLDAARRAGITHVGLAVDAPTTPPPPPLP